MCGLVYFVAEVQPFSLLDYIISLQNFCFLSLQLWVGLEVLIPNGKNVSIKWYQNNYIELEVEDRKSVV